MAAGKDHHRQGDNTDSQPQGAVIIADHHIVADHSPAHDRDTDQQGDDSLPEVTAGQPGWSHAALWGQDSALELPSTTHISIVDGDGNALSMTTTIENGFGARIMAGGFLLNNELTDFSFETHDAEGRPIANALAPGKRPRTTLTPSLALKDGRPTLAFGTPGGDQQDQWQLAFFLRYVHHEGNLQAAIDQPLFHSTHFPASFYPRTSEPGGVMTEDRMGDATIAELRRRGHKLTVADGWSIGRLTAARRERDGLIRAAATPRLMQAYAVGR